jgi:hypothetical protein
MTQRRLLSRHTPHEGTHEVGALDLEGIEQADGVVGEVGGGERPARVLAR